MMTNPTDQEPREAPFDVYIPNERGDDIASTVRIKIPVRRDPNTGDEIPYPSAHELIRQTKLIYQLRAELSAERKLGDELVRFARHSPKCQYGRTALVMPPIRYDSDTGRGDTQVVPQEIQCACTCGLAAALAKHKRMKGEK